MSKYQPKMNDRVRVAWAVPEDAEWRGATGTVVGFNSLWVSVEVDVALYGADIVKFSTLDFRLEAE